MKTKLTNDQIDTLIDSFDQTPSPDQITTRKLLQICSAMNEQLRQINAAAAAVVKVVPPVTPPGQDKKK